MTVIDDLDGTVIEDGTGETVLFSVDGISFEIDLSSKNASKLRETLGKYIDAGRRVSGSSRRTSTRSKSNSADLQKIRDWAAENGVEVSQRGRIAQSVVDQYNAAN